MQPEERSSETPQPYPPSWYNRLSTWLDGLPGSAWMYFLAAGVVYSGAFIYIQSTLGAYSERGFYPWHIFLALQPLIALGTMFYLDKVAVAALTRFEPVMKSDSPTVRQARYQLITLPSKPTLITTFGGVVAYFILFGASFSQSSPSMGTAASSLEMFGLSASTLSLAAFLFTLVMMWAFIGVLVYHTIHQLRVVRRLLAADLDVNPFQPEPLYAFSSLTGATAGLLLLNSYGWLWGVLAGPAQSGGTNVLSAFLVTIFFAALSLTIFVWPLWGAHLILHRSKRLALHKNTDLYSSAAAEIHRMVAARQVEGVDDWQKALAALDLERAQIEKLPTWPWRPEALRGLVAAILLPTVIWLIQRLLDRLMG